MDVKFSLVDDDKENSSELDVEEVIQNSSIMSRPSTVQFSNKSFNPLCKKHEAQTLSEDQALMGKSFVEILGVNCQYMIGNTIPNCPTGQISVCTSVDVLQLLHQSKPEPPSSSVDSDISQSLLPEVKGLLHCRLSCYNSCFGSTSRGEVDLIITLEAKSNDSHVGEETYKVFGLSKISVRCCSCPARDAKSDCKQSDSPDKNSRRLSLNLSSQSNIRLKNDSSSIRRSCPSKIQKVENINQIDSCSSVIIDGKKYYITVTDDQGVATSNMTMRNSAALISEQWRYSGSHHRKLKQIKKFYKKLECYISDCVSRDMSRKVTDPIVSQGSQDSTSSTSSTSDKQVGTDDI
uniref:p53 DNA-binding domain-containing protein n=1 Tax=Trichobilharzia regenti TaxID=157069 RepID=A0AA85JWX2_TRIRE|nr:unnamed protein product [Trichobilharzia regenti]